MADIINSFEMAMITAQTPFFAWPNLASIASGSITGLELPIGIVGPGSVAIALAAVQIHPSANLTADNTNNATITVNKRTAAAPGTPVALAVSTTSVSGANSTGNWTAFTTFSMTLVTGAFVSPGDEITVALTKAGTGPASGLPALFLGGFMTIR